MRHTSHISKILFGSPCPFKTKFTHTLRVDGLYSLYTEMSFGVCLAIRCSHNGWLCVVGVESRKYKTKGFAEFLNYTATPCGNAPCVPCCCCCSCCVTRVQCDGDLLVLVCLYVSQPRNVCVDTFAVCVRAMVTSYRRHSVRATRCRPLIV